MATDLEKLVISMSADFKAYEKALAKAQGTTVSGLRKIERDAQASMGRVEKSFARAGSALAGFGKGLVIGGVFAAVAGLEQLVTNAVSSAAAIGDLSDKLGISSDKLQELQYGAVQANMSFDELESSLLKFSKALGEARNGQGDLLKTLEANGFDKAEIKAMSYSQALDTVADLVKNAANEQDALLIITQAFGKGGDDMLEFLRNGSAGLKGFATDAHDAGAVVDKELIQKAQELDDRWAALMVSMKSATQSFVIETVGLFEGMVISSQSVFKDLADAWEFTKQAMAGKSTNGTRVEPDGFGGFNIVDDRSSNNPMAPAGTASAAGKTSITNSGGAKPASTALFDPEKAKADAAAFTQAQQEKSDAIKRLIDFSIEQQARQREADEKQLELDKELYDSKMALAAIAVDAFEAIIINGEKAEDVLKGLVKQLAHAAIQALLLGQGPLAGIFGTGAGGGIFGSLFGAPKAGGGHVNAGTAYPVGEKGPELFVPSSSGTIVPHGKSGGQNIVFAPRIDARGADAGAIARLTNDFRVMQRDFAKNVRNTVSGEKSLNPRFAR